VNRMGYRYSRWDGSQDVSPFTADDVMDAIADDLIADGDLRNALQRLSRWGAENDNGDRMQGVQDVLERLRERKQQEMNRYKLDSVLEDLKKRLQDVVETERGGIQKRMDQGKPKDQDSQPPSATSSDPTATDDREASSRQESSAGSEQQNDSAAPQSGNGDSSDISEEQKDSLRRMIESMEAEAPIP